MKSIAIPLMLATSLLAAPIAVADLGPLPDPVWGGTGADSTVYIGFNLVANAYDRGATSSLVQPDGKLVMAGLALAVTSSSTYDIAVVRLNASDGSPDASFGGGDGRLNLNLVSSTIRSARVVRDPNARLMISAGQTDSSAVILRLTSEGDLDPDFDQDGKKFVSAGNFLDGAATIADSPIVLPQTNGKYLVFATVYRPGPPVLMCAGVIRLNANGSSDPTFAAGTGRICEAPPYETLNAAQGLDVTTTSQGDLLIAGAAYHTGSAVWDMSVLKISTEGVRDGTFGENGWAFVPFDEGGSLIDYASAIHVDAQGRIVIGGAVSVGTFEQVAAISRLSGEGQIETTFGQSGKMVLDLGPVSRIPYSESPESPSTSGDASCWGERPRTDLSSP